MDRQMFQDIKRAAYEGKRRELEDIERARTTKARRPVPRHAIERPSDNERQYHQAEQPYDTGEE